METYIIRRRSAWADGEELEVAGAKSKQIGDDEMSDDIRWIRSYAVQEDDGRVGTVCVYQASSPEAIRDHAERVGMPADEITPVLDTVIIRPDPTPVVS
jgi:hypothetical protein